MRHPVELAVQQELPIAPKPAATGADAASVSRPFALLLAEAEAVRDVVQISAPPMTVSALRGAWDFLCARLPWTGLVAQPAFAPIPRAARMRRR